MQKTMIGGAVGLVVLMMAASAAQACDSGFMNLGVGIVGTPPTFMELGAHGPCRNGQVELRFYEWTGSGNREVDRFRANVTMLPSLDCGPDGFGCGTPTMPGGVFELEAKSLGTFLRGVWEGGHTGFQINTLVTQGRYRDLGAYFVEHTQTES